MIGGTCCIRHHISLALETSCSKRHPWRQGPRSDKARTIPKLVPVDEGSTIGYLVIRMSLLTWMIWGYQYFWKHPYLVATCFSLSFNKTTQRQHYRQALGFAHPPTIGYLTNQLLGILPTNYWVSYQPTIGYLTNQLLGILPTNLQHSFYQFFPPPLATHAN